MFLIALFLVLPILWLLFANWQLALVGLGIWILVRIVLAVKGPKAREVSCELPSPNYLPKWTVRRKLDAKRELAQWQEWFDAAS